MKVSPIKIVILDDDRPDRDRLLIFCERYAGETGLDIEADAFARPGDLPEDMSAYDAALFDIMMEETASGVDAARALRGTGWKGALVFITGSGDFYPQGFEVNATHYLIKPVAYGAFAEAMERVIEKAGRRGRTVTLPVPRGKITLPERDILFAEVYDHNTLIHTMNGKLRVNVTLTETEALLSKEYFLRCFRSYVVNMAHIERMDEAHFILTGGVRVNISQRNRQEIHNRYLDYRSAVSKGGG